ncbi:MAG: hypothetical protein ACOX1M_03435 [Erysipelotrichaceae bacterium]
MKNKTWLITFLTITLSMVIIVCSITIYVDPYMHYHKPLTDKFYYNINNQRSQNNGIVKHFEYDAIITGTSMTENFYASEVDRIFECKSIKVPYSGGSFKEINDNLEIALSINPNIKYIIRGLDLSRVNFDKNHMRTDLGKFPTYLYDNNPFNDVNYLLNRNVLYNRIIKMVNDALSGKPTGITSFDRYSNWMSRKKFGNKTVLKSKLIEGIGYKETEQVKVLNDLFKDRIRGNIEQNVTSLAEKYPNTTFYYFIPPYSAAYWGYQMEAGNMLRQIEMIEYVLSLIVPHKNIHMFCWNRFDLFDDLNNYGDLTHYGDWINSWIIAEMKRESGRLTEDNYKDYINELKEHYMNFDFNSLFEQIDYEADYYISGLLNKEILGTDPMSLDGSFFEQTEIKNANIVMNQFNYTDGIECYGVMSRLVDSKESIDKSMFDGDFCGIKFTIDVSDYRCLVFYGKKLSNNGQYTVSIFDNVGNLLNKISAKYTDLDDNWHQYAISLAGIYGEVTIVMNGGYTDQSGSINSRYIFSNIILY